MATLVAWVDLKQGWATLVKAATEKKIEDESV